MENSAARERGAAPVLRLNGVTKSIGGKRIVDGLTFEIGSGEVVGLLGPNGAGKTTTIRMIVGLIAMTEGDVFVGGHSIRQARAEAMRQVGGIIENPEFYPYLSGYDNMRQYRRMTPEVSDERILEVIRLVGLTDAMGKKVKTYSLGMRQRLGIAQALLHRPRLLILDEPTNGLDPAGIREMREYLKKIAGEEGISVLVSSHLLTEIEQMCNRVVVIQEGKLVTVRGLGEAAAEAGGPEKERVTVALKVGDGQEAKARGLIEAIRGIEVLDASDRLVLRLAEKEVPELVSRLAAEQIRIHRIEEQRTTLEDEFLKWTGGNRIA